MFVRTPIMFRIWIVFSLTNTWQAYYLCFPSLDCSIKVLPCNYPGCVCCLIPFKLSFIVLLVTPRFLDPKKSFSGPCLPFHFHRFWYDVAPRIWLLCFCLPVLEYQYILVPLGTLLNRCFQWSCIICSYQIFSPWKLLLILPLAHFIMQKFMLEKLKRILLKYRLW